MHAIQFLQDLAIIMLIAGLVTVIFHRLKQPVVLGYILVGVIIGPHTPPFPLIQDEQTIRTLAELGVVFLMFSLGLEFSLRRLRAVGATAFVAALAEIVLMLWLGFEIGRFFGWGNMDALFLGAMLAISSTTIIVKALDELGLKRERFAQIIFGILIVEDILAIAIIVLLSGMAVGGTVDTAEVLATLRNLMLFIVVALVAGLLVVPRLLAYVARFKNDEMLLVTVLGLFFGFCLLAARLDYSMALGAFVIGAIMAESHHLKAIEKLVWPIRDMFSAIFFVAIGLMLDPQALVEYAVPIAVITLAVVAGKVLTCSLGTFVAGHDGRTSLRVGMGLAQIGEFSFIIATLGLTLAVISDFLYTIAVAVSVLTTLLTPYLIRGSDPLATRIARHVPVAVGRTLALYTAWLQNIRPSGDRAILAGIVRRILLQVFVNFSLVAAIFLGGAHLAIKYAASVSGAWNGDPPGYGLLWGAALVLSTPFLIAAYRKLKALSLLLAELSVGGDQSGVQNDKARMVVAELIPASAILGMVLLLSALSSSILPPAHMLILVLGVAGLLSALLWRWFVNLHHRLQVALMDTLQHDGEEN